MDVYRNPANTFVAGFLASPPMNLLEGRLDASSNGAIDAVIGDARLQMPASLAAGFQTHHGKAVIIGLRPEDFHLSASAARHAVELTVVAITTEVLGPEVILVANLAHARGPEVQVRMPRDFLAKPDEAVKLYFDLSQIQIFDSTTTRALPRQASK